MGASCPDGTQGDTPRMIMLDTNYLIAAEQPGSEVDRRLRQWLANGETFAVSTIVWTEYLCGPLAADKVAAVEFLVRRKESFLAADAPLTARLFNAAGRRRGTLTDCMIAAVAIRCHAAFATLNRDDFTAFVAHGLELV